MGKQVKGGEKNVAGGDVAVDDALERERFARGCNLPHDFNLVLHGHALVVIVYLLHDSTRCRAALIP